MKYALLEMDRKFTELEKKSKTTGGAGARTTAAGRAGAGSSTTRGTVAGKGGVNSSTTTPRGSSRAANQGSAGIGDARARSKTPTAGRMQNTLNTSVTSKTGAAAKTGAATNRADSKSRNNDIQSSGMKKTGALTS